MIIQTCERILVSFFEVLVETFEEKEYGRERSQVETITKDPSPSGINTPAMLSCLCVRFCAQDFQLFRVCVCSSRCRRGLVVELVFIINLT